MGVCRIAIINKGIKYWGCFFVLPEKGPALLGITDHEHLQLLSINCQIINDQQKGKQLNKQNEIKQKHWQLFYNNPHTHNKIKLEIDYFIQDPGMEA